jgi:inositol-hexakisphosphate/diphosphoinositol-pentakisphosphate 1-kinase
LTDEEKAWAARICEGFGQRVCGFDMLRCDGGTRSQVIDVNGWSFVKGNDTYYGISFRVSNVLPYQFIFLLLDRAADILTSLCLRLFSSPDRHLIHSSETAAVDQPTWLLKANVTVLRHADRTPKQKLKFNFPIGEAWTEPFVTLLHGEKEEIILREKEQLSYIAQAITRSKELGAKGEDLAKLTHLSNALQSKIDLPGTKAQLKPVFSKKQAGQSRTLTKLTLVFKWGGEVCLLNCEVMSWTSSTLFSLHTLQDTNLVIWERILRKISLS